MKRITPGLVCLVILVSVCSTAQADGVSIDKIYDPYVQLLEKEVEYRLLLEENSGTAGYPAFRHKLGYGQSLSDRFFAELYLIGTDQPGSGFGLQAYEIELKWQLTEQGEFGNDWGVLLELERGWEKNNWEINSTLIGLHEWSDWILTGNLSLIYEWGPHIPDEIETAFAGQLRYRNNEKFEPAIELYQAQNTQGIGPVVTGLYRLDGGRKINWEMGVIFATSSKSADSNWKFGLEYEF